MSVTHGMYQPAKAVIAPGADTGIFSACIGCFLIYRIAKDVVDALHLPAIAVCVECEITFFVILEGFFITELVCALADFSEAVITVLDGIAVSVDGSAYLSCVVVLVTFFYTVREACPCDSAPAVCTVGGLFMVSVNDACDLSSGVILILLSDCRFYRMRSLSHFHCQHLFHSCRDGFL